jgi:DNA-directed RNA polymerase specialized sigma24 family protein
VGCPVRSAAVARAASGDEIAFAQIVAAHHDDMARVSFIVCRDVQLAQEAASAAWPIAWRKLSTLRDPARLRPWPLAIAANEARGLARQRDGALSGRSPSIRCRNRSLRRVRRTRPSGSRSSIS